MKRFAEIALLGSLVFALGCHDDREGNGVVDEPPFGSGDGGVEAGSNCVSSTRTAVPIPLDVIFLLDRSGSMKGPKWNAMSTATVAFANQGFPAPTRVGLSFVPFVVGEDFWGDQHGTNIQVCEYRLYKELVLPLGPVAAQRGPLESAIAGALIPGSAGFGTSSPLYAALQGTYFAATKTQDENPDHQVVVVMMGDGDPTPCEDYGLSASAKALADLSAAALRYNGVRTFAVGLENTTLALLDRIAAAGGGKVLKPPSYSTGDLLEQMNLVTRSAIDCVFALPEIPSPQTIDPKSVSVSATLRTGETESVARIADAMSCRGEKGFYLDNATKPKRAILCPSSCTALRASSGSRIEITSGCAGGVQ